MELPNTGITGERSILLTYAEFLKLKEAGTPEPEPDAPPRVALREAAYVGELRGQVALLEARYTVDVSARAKQEAETTLTWEGVALESVAWGEGRQAADRLEGAGDGPGLRLLTQGPGTRTLVVRLTVPAEVKGDTVRLGFGVPRPLAGTLRLTLPHGMRPAENDDFGAEVTDAATTSLLTAAMGGVSRVDLTLKRPRVTIAAGEAPPVRFDASQHLQVRVRAKSALATAWIAVTPLPLLPATLVISLPPGATPIQVEGKALVSWARQEDGKLALEIRDGDARQTAQKFRIEFEAPLATEESPLLRVVGLAVAGALRDTTALAVEAEGDAVLWPEAMTGLELAARASIAAPEGAAAPGQSARFFRAYKPGWSLDLSSRRIEPRLTQSSTIVYDVTEDWLRVRTGHRVTIAERGVFDVSYELPVGMELREALPASLLAGYRQEENRAILSFRGEQLGLVELGLRLERKRATAEEPVRLEAIRLIGSAEETGTVLVAAPPALKATERTVQGLRATDARRVQFFEGALGAESVATLGYTFDSGAFAGQIDIERQRTRLTCDTAILASIAPSTLKIDATLSYRVEFSPTDEFQLRLPAAAGQDVRFQGADIKEKVRSEPDAGDDLTTWTLRLQRRVLGEYQLGVSFDQTLPEASVAPATARGAAAKPVKLSVPVVHAVNVARETGHLGIARGENLEVRTSVSEGLEDRDPKELPQALTRSFLGFRYFRPDWKLELELVRHENQEVLGALVRRMHAETVLSDQGEAVHEVFLEIQNNREQYLELELPESMTLWSAFVRGVPVRPTRRQADGVYLLELIRPEGGNKAFRVRLVLRQTLASGPLDKKFRGSLLFEPIVPLNMPVLRATWRLYLPRPFTYTAFGGTMRLERGDTPSWLEPASELLLADLPAGIAGGVAQPMVRPRNVASGSEYGVQETPEELAGRGTATALEIPIVREGQSFLFSKLSGLSGIEVSYWRRRAHVALLGAVALLALLGIVALHIATKRSAYPLIATAALFVAAGLTRDMTGRLLGAALVGAGVGLAILALLGALRLLKRLRAAKPKQPEYRWEPVPLVAPAPAAAPAPEPATPPSAPVQPEPEPVVTTPAPDAAPPAESAPESAQPSSAPAPPKPNAPRGNQGPDKKGGKRS